MTKGNERTASRWLKAWSRFVERVGKRLGEIGASDGETTEEIGERKALVMASAMMAIPGACWSLLYIALGHYVTGAIPGVYSLVTVLSLAILTRSRRIGWYRNSQILLILTLPFGVQTTLGGFEQGSAVMLWAFLPVMGALIFHRRYAFVWFAIYLAGILASAIVNDRLRAGVQPMSEAARLAFWVGNIGGVSLLVFFVMRYFITYVQEQRQGAQTALLKIEEQAAQLRELDRTKTLFFAGISHELRTPLTLLLGPLQTVLEGNKELPDQVRTQLGMASRNGRRLLRQINMLLEVTKAQTKDLELERTHEDPGELVKRLVEDVRPAAEANRLALTLELAPARAIDADHDRLEQALLNLLGNAIKFTPPGGNVTLLVSETEDGVRFTVRDTGIGIPHDELPFVFDTFRQVKARARAATGAAMYRQDHQGSGLGLSLVREIVELHGGRVDVESEIGKGSAFHITIPAAELRPSECLAMATRLPEGRGRHRVDLADVEVAPASERVVTSNVESNDSVELASERGRPNVLIVDDQADVRTYLRGLLQDSYSLREADDGQAGIDAAIANPPDLIISDIMMPRKSGFELIAELKSHARIRHVPILLLTARGGVDEVVEGLAYGADDYLSKPFNPKELQARVRALLRLTQAERELGEERRRLAAVIQSTAAVILTFDKRGRVTPCNPHATTLLEALGVDISGQGTMFELSADESWKAHCAAALEGRSARFDHELTIQGEQRFFDFALTPRTDEQGSRSWIVIATDITQRTRAARDNAQLAAAIQVVSEMIVVADADFHPIYTNPAFEEITGYEPSEVAKADLFYYRLVTEEGAKRREAIERVRSGEPWSGSFRLSRRGGGVIEVEQTLTPVVDERGAVSAVVSVGRDITERRAAAAREAALNKQLMEVSREAGMAQVATGVLHNVGNVLNSVKVSCSLVSDGVREFNIAGLGKSATLLRSENAGQATVRAKLADYLERLAGELVEEQHGALAELTSLTKSIDHIGVIVSHQQSFARGKKACSETLSPTELFEDALRTSELSFDVDRIKIVREFDDVPSLVAPRHRVLEILINLLTNARDAVTSSTTGLARIRVRIASGNDRMRFEVADNGQGIMKENLTRIFTHGFTTKPGGHGFGLHASALAAQEMGGTLRAESDGFGLGATFVLELPLTQPPEERAGAAAATAPMSAAPMPEDRAAPASP